MTVQPMSSARRYCQGFNFIAGFALLFLSEEMAFWCVVTLIGTIMPDGYFTDPMTGVILIRHPFLVCTRKFEPNDPLVTALAVIIIQELKFFLFFLRVHSASRADQPILRDIVMNHIPQLSEVLEIHQFDLSLVRAGKENGTMPLSASDLSEESVVREI